MLECYVQVSVSLGLRVRAQVLNPKRNSVLCVKKLAVLINTFSVSACVFLPKEDREFMSRIRQLYAIEDLFQRLTSFVEDNLLRSDGSMKVQMINHTHHLL